MLSTEEFTATFANILVLNVGLFLVEQRGRQEVKGHFAPGDAVPGFIMVGRRTFVERRISGT
jgi:hypothetical protein